LGRGFTDGAFQWGNLNWLAFIELVLHREGSVVKEVSLALGGGGVKGHAHIGVLKVLVREGFKIQAIAGTSAGGLWGSFFAAGYSPDEIERRMRQVPMDALYRRKPEDSQSIMGLAGLQEVLEREFGDLKIEDLLIPFAVTAVDIDAAQLIVLNRGRLVDAILATIAVPGVFPPKIMGNRVLIDGGVLDPVPVNLARSLAPGLPVAAVVLSPPIDEWVQPTPPRLLNSLPFLTSYLSRMRVAKALNVFLRSVDIGGAMFTEMRLQLDRPEVIIRPPVPHIGLLDDVDLNEVVLLGEVGAEKELEKLNHAVGWRARVSRKLMPSLHPLAVRRPNSNDYRWD
jgi:NTE family protein